MKIYMTGSHGLIGASLTTYLMQKGHEVVRLVRHTASAGEAEIQWDPDGGIADLAQLEGADVMVHLAGENIASGRWTSERKRRIRDSRVTGTHALSECLVKLERPPKVFVVASAIGFYGSRGEAIVDEASDMGTGFLAEVCRDWEAASKPALKKGIRVVHIRTGVVLSQKGGALAKMLPGFSMGIAGCIGSGRQYMSWIAIDDVLAAIEHVIVSEDIRGPVNLVTPHPVTNRQFTKVLSHVLKRPAFLSAPAFALRIVFGEMADEMLLASTRVKPSRLLATKYHFQYPELEPALRHLLNK